MYDKVSTSDKMCKMNANGSGTSVPPKMSMQNSEAKATLPSSNGSGTSVPPYDEAKAIVSKNSYEYIEYEVETDLRDSENIPLNQKIHEYFLKEVKTHVQEAWINLDSVKIGYEISFNKYFYKHKPLRSIEEVTKDIVELEKQSDGLIKEILGL